MMQYMFFQMRFLIRGGVLCLVLFLAAHLRAANVGPAGYTNDFSAQPSAADWATLSIAGAASDIYVMDTEANNLAASSFTAQCLSSNANPPNAFVTALWVTAGYLQVRATGNRATALLGKFVNASGSNATQLALAYTHTFAGNAVVEDVGYGTRIYYSLTGLAGSWANLPTLNTEANSGSLARNTNLTINWLNGTNFYLLILDDNSNYFGDKDTANQFDNFSLSVTAGNLAGGTSVALTAPANNAVFNLAVAPNIALAATATNAGVGITNVEFFQGGVQLAQDSTAPYDFNWSGLVTGSYVLRAVAVDAAGGRTTSSPVNISVVSNYFPTVSLTNPANGATFTTPASLTLQATTTDGAGTVTNVSFYGNNVLVGSDASNPYSFVWNGATLGNNPLYAVAKDTAGWSVTSAVVSVTVTSAPVQQWVAYIDDKRGPQTSNNVTALDFYTSSGAKLTNVINGQPGPATLLLTRSGYLGSTLVTTMAEPNVGSPAYDAFHGFVDFATGTSGNNGMLVYGIPSGQTPTVLTLTFTNLDPARRYSFTGTSVRGGVPGADSSGGTLNGYFSNRWTKAELVGAVSYTPAHSSGVMTSNLFPADLTNSQAAYNSGVNNEGAIVRWDSIAPAADGTFVVLCSQYGGHFTGSGSGTAVANYAYAINAIRLVEVIPSSAPIVLTQPVNNAVVSLMATSSVTLAATVSGSGATVTNVAFYQGTTKLGDDDTAPFAFTWGSLIAESYTLSAVSTDNLGANATSAPVNITIVNNINPTVTLTNPLGGSSFSILSNITLGASASDSDGTIAKVEFYQGTNKLGEDLTGPIFSYVWSGLVAGNYSLTAVATDGNGGVTTSAPPVSVSVVANFPPTISISSPANGALFLPGASVTINATASDSDGSVTNVYFYDGSTLLGSDTVAPYSLTVAGLANGNHSLKAVAKDSGGLTSTSAPVVINLGDPVLVRRPYLQSGSPTGGEVRWRTDKSTDAVVFYGTNVANLTNVAMQNTVTSNHLVTISGLTPATRYYYQIGSSIQSLAGGTNAGGSNFWFRTSPVAGTPQPTRIWVLGDAGTASNSGNTGANQRAVRDAYQTFAATNRAADLWLMLGDNAYNTGTDSEYQTSVVNMYTNTLPNLFLWPVLGNHESAQSYTATSFSYLDIFSTPTNGQAGGMASKDRKYYSFDYANIHFIGLDTMTSTRATNSAMALWLQDDLGATSQEWIIVYFHHPPYTKGSHNSDSETDLMEVRQNLMPILEAHGVDLVLSGHSHAYERSFLLDGHYGLSGTITTNNLISGLDGRADGDGAYQKDSNGRGVVYTVAGSSGQTSTSPALNHPAHYIGLNQLGSLIIDVASNRLDMMFLTSSNVTQDHFTLLKPVITPPATPITLATHATSTNQIEVSWSDAATNELGFYLERSLDGTNFTRIAILGMNTTNFVNSGLLSATAYYYRVIAYNSGGESAVSSIVNAVTGHLPPVLSAFLNQAGGVRTITLYGTVGVQYFVDKTATPELPASWQLWQTITLTNLWKTLDAGADSNAPSIFYRARE